MKFNFIYTNIYSVFPIRTLFKYIIVFRNTDHVKYSMIFKTEMYSHILNEIKILLSLLKKYNVTATATVNSLGYY